MFHRDMLVYKEVRQATFLIIEPLQSLQQPSAYDRGFTLRKISHEFKDDFKTSTQGTTLKKYSEQL